MRKVKRYLAVAVAGAFCAAASPGQDSVDVTFRYVNVSAASVSVPGEFNGWSNTAWPMTNIGGGVWTRTARLRLGGNPSPPVNGVPGAWQYKFYYPGASPWPNDPLNHHQNAADNGNSYLYIRNPTIYQLIPNQRNPVVTTSTPQISAYLFPSVGSEVDTGTIAVTIDGTVHTGIGGGYNSSTRLFQYTPSVPLLNGDHTVILTAGASSDTVTFATQAGYVQITSRGGFATIDSLRSIRGAVPNGTVSSVKIVRNGTDTTVAPVAGGRFVVRDTLSEGANTFVALADSSGALAMSQPVTFSRIVSHTPTGRVSVTASGGSVTLDAAPTTDPDGETVTDVTWMDDPSTPLGLGGRTGVTAQVAQPGAAGEYYFTLRVADAAGHADTSRQCLIVTPAGGVEIAGSAWAPEWARKARVYFLFPKALTSSGTLTAAAAHLSRIRDLGFSVIWLMPVMKNAYPINNGTGPGYNIVDFDAVAPEYGTSADLRSFVDQAHLLGMKVILDVTPNHTGRFHPWAADARTYGEDSRYWTWYEHTIIPHNDNGLGQSLDGSGFNYYSGFSDQLLNYNWRDPDARAEMIRVYSSWITRFGLDGYRFDVYWGPHRRYGEQYMGAPVRDALKHRKPDLLLLAEDDGTGSGTEVIYADRVNGGIHGGVDAAYDFKLYFNQIRGFGFAPSAIDNLHSEISNGGFYPGPNALYMRFMESQDEDRITYFYSGAFSLDAATTFRRTMPVASVLFTAPGFPMIWNGQEIGWGYGINGDKLARNRSIINWGYVGKDLLTAHYQKLAHIRGQFPAFTFHKEDTNQDGSVTAEDEPDFIRIPSGSGNVYAFLRPYTDQNGVSVVNVSGVEVNTSILIPTTDLKFSSEFEQGTLYFLNDLYTNTRQQVSGSSLTSLPVSLPAYGTAIYTISTTADTLRILNPWVGVDGAEEAPLEYRLEQNYPNPFNPRTTIQLKIEDRGSSIVKVFDLLGREVAVLMNEVKEPGTYAVEFDGTGLASGVYIYRMTSGSFTQTRKMILLR